MTKLLEHALQAVRRLSEADQDKIARAILMLAGEAEETPAPLSDAEEQAIARSKAAAVRGDFATDEQVHAVWTKHGQ